MRLKDDRSMYYLHCEKMAKKENLFEEAKSNLEESILLVNNESMYELSKVYYKGIGTSMDQAKEIEYFKKSCENNYPKAMYKYRLILKESKYGIGYIVQAASKGYSKAMYYYSQLLKKSDAKPSDIELSNNYLISAANKGQFGILEKKFDESKNDGKDVS